MRRGRGHERGAGAEDRVCRRFGFEWEKRATEPAEATRNSFELVLIHFSQAQVHSLITTAVQLCSNGDDRQHALLARLRTFVSDGIALPCIACLCSGTRTRAQLLVATANARPLAVGDERRLLRRCGR